MIKLLNTFIVTMILATVIFANEAVFFKDIGKEGTGGTVGTNAIFVYKVNADINNDNIKLVMFEVKKQICAQVDTRSVVEDYGMTVSYIYVSKNGVGVVSVDSCK